MSEVEMAGDVFARASLVVLPRLSAPTTSSYTCIKIGGCSR